MTYRCTEGVGNCKHKEVEVEICTYTEEVVGTCTHMEEVGTCRDMVVGTYRQEVTCICMEVEVKGVTCRRKEEKVMVMAMCRHKVEEIYDRVHKVACKNKAAGTCKHTVVEAVATYTCRVVECMLVEHKCMACRCLQLHELQQSIIPMHRLDVAKY